MKVIIKIQRTREVLCGISQLSYWITCNDRLCDITSTFEEAQSRLSQIISAYQSLDAEIELQYTAKTIKY